MKIKTLHNPFLREGKLIKSLILSSKKDIKKIEDTLTDIFDKKVFLLNSARTGIYLALKAKGFQRTDEIVVPNYMGQCVLNAINHTAFPSSNFNQKTKGVLLLHQYGYPQKIDDIKKEIDNYFVIEDCAHTIDSIYKGKKVGEFFDCAVYSFPKIFSIPQGGCIISDDEDIIRCINNSLKKTKRRLDLIQTYLFSLLLYKVQNTNKQSEELTMLIESIYSQMVHIPKIPKKIGKLFPNIDEINEYSKKRKKILKIFKENIGKEYFPTVENDTVVTPYFIPFIDSPDILKKIKSKLHKKDIDLPIYHFDKNRNILSPEYIKSFIIPTHQTIEWSVFEEIIETFKQELLK